MNLEKFCSENIDLEYHLKTDYKQLYFESGINLNYNLLEYNIDKYK